MKTLLMLLSGPQQSWGCRSKFNERDTEPFPTYSGILGLVGCAMGIDRDDTAGLESLTDMMMSVRIDQPGAICSDWQVAHSQRIEIDADNKFNSACYRVVSESDKGTYAARRQYLADAKFIVALTGKDDQIDAVASAIRKPRWALHLGRRGFVPDAPIFYDIVNSEDVLDIFKRVPWMASERCAKKGRPGSLEAWLDSRLNVSADPIAFCTRKDMPVSFSSRHRKYLTHEMKEYTIPIESLADEGKLGENGSCPVDSDQPSPIDFLVEFNSEQLTSE